MLHAAGGVAVLVCVGDGVGVGVGIPEIWGCKAGDPKPYYCVDSDLNAIASSIRQRLTANNRWGSPKVIAGES